MRKTFFVVGLALVLVLASYTVAFAFSAGVSGNTTGCTPCHSSTAAKPAVSISGPDDLSTGQSGTYTVTITGGPSGTSGGLDFGISQGSLAAGSNTRVLNGEITHASEARSFTFTVTAPQTAGTIMLTGAGLAADNDGTTAGDTFNTASKSISVTAATTTTGATTTTSIPAPPTTTTTVAPTTTSTTVLATTTTTVAATTTTGREVLPFTGAPLNPIAPVGAGIAALALSLIRRMRK